MIPLPLLSKIGISEIFDATTTVGVEHLFSDVCLIFNIGNEVLTLSFFKRNEDVCQPKAESDGISFSFSRSNVLEQNRGNRMFERF